MPNCPDDAAIPNTALKHANRVHENCYFLSGGFLYMKAYTEHRFPHRMVDAMFLSLIALMSIDDKGERAQATDVVKSVRAHHLKHIDQG